MTVRGEPRGYPPTALFCLAAAAGGIVRGLPARWGYPPATQGNQNFICGAKSLPTGKSRSRDISSW